MLNVQESASKTEQASAALVALLHTRGPGIKLPTIEEMCALFGVSRTTLEVALQTVERRGLIRRRRGSGIYGTERIRQRTIGMVFGGDIFSAGFSPYWSLLLQAVGTHAGAFGVAPQAYLDIPQGQGGLGGHPQLFDDLEAGRLDGLLLFAFDSTDSEVEHIRGYGIPLVLPCGAPPDWVVTEDYDACIRLAAREIARQSRRHIGLLAPLDYRTVLAAELQRLGVADVRIDDWSYDTWAQIIPGAGSHEHCAYRLTQHMIDQAPQHPLPEVVVSLEDTATRGVLIAVLQAGRQPGRDLALISSANAGSPVLTPYAAEICCLVFDPTAHVRAALTMLETLLAGATPPVNPVLIAPTLAPHPPISLN
jgi:DNA-binding LacI/PurR family transcriptional regulator